MNLFRFANLRRSVAALLAVAMVTYLGVPLAMANEAEPPAPAPEALTLKEDSKQPALPQTGEIIVRFRESQSPEHMTMLLAGLTATAAPKGENGRLHVIRPARAESVAETLQTLRADPRVEFAEPNYLFRASATSDPRFGEQWSLSELQAEWGWSRGRSLNAAPAPVTVAVVDTGVDTAHEDLAGRLAPGVNALSGAADPSDLSDASADGHGTHAAGLIAATAENAVGIAGVAGQFPVAVMPVKALDASGFGSMLDIANGIRWAADHGARVINLSFGARLPDYPVTLAEAVQYAQDQGALVVAAAGNEAQSYAGFYPASLPGVVPVSAMGQDHAYAIFTNYGKVNAPGVSVLSTLPGNQYGAASGTSVAAAATSGVAAVLRSVFPARSAAEVAKALENGQKSYWNGYTQSQVLSLDLALTQLSGGASIPNSIQMLEPTGRVRGTTKFVARVADPARVDLVKFLLIDGAGSSQLLGSLNGPAASGLFELEWDSTVVPDGTYTVQAAAFDANNQQITSGGTRFDVYNAALSGLSFQVQKPDGAPAADAAIEIYYANNGAMELLEQGRTDLNGNYFVSGAKATDGNQFLVLARGSEPNFLYMKTLTAPAEVTLDRTETYQVTFVGKDGAGQPAGNAAVWPVVRFGSQMVAATAPLATLSAGGTATAYLSAGNYTFRQYSADMSEYQVLRNVGIAGEATVTIEPPAGGLAKLTVQPDPAFFQNRATFTDVADGYKLQGPDTLSRSVTPGAYSATAEGWTMSQFGYKAIIPFAIPTFQVAAGENRTIPVGGTPTLSISTTKVGPVQTQEDLPFTAELKDQYGNLMPGQSPDLMVKGPSGTTENAGWPNWSSWRHSQPGTYQVWGEHTDSLWGTVRSQTLTFEVVQGTPGSTTGDFVINITDLAGQPLNYGKITLKEKGARGWNTLTTQQIYGGGRAAFNVPNYNSAAEHLLVVSGMSPVSATDPGAGWAQLTTVSPVPAGGLPVTMTIDMRGVTFHQVDFTVQDALGQPMGGQLYGFLAYGADGLPVGLDLGGVDGAGDSFYLPEGSYRFEVVRVADRYYAGDQYLLFSDAVSVPAAGVVALGGAGQLTKLTVAAPAGQPDLTLAGVGVFVRNSSDFYSPRLSATSPVYVTPGAYSVETVLVRNAGGHLWDYWLARSVDATAGADVAWQVDASFTVEAAADRPVLESGAALTTTQRIMDSFGNRLVRVAIDKNLSGGGRLQAEESLTSGDPSQVAPFLVIKDAAGQEVYRAKQVGPDEALVVSRWQYCYSNCAPLLPTNGPSSYFGQSVPVPAEWSGRQFTAAVEVGAGPEGPVRSAPFTFSVSNAPLLDAQAPATREAGVTITGATQAGAQVDLSYSRDGGAPLAAGSVTAGADGRFSLYVALAEEGSYAFTAVATQAGKVSDPSAPLTVVVDRTAPGAPADLAWTSPDQTHVRLTWSAPAPDVARYEIRRDGQPVGEVAATAALMFLDGGLEANARFTYSVAAIDRAGNISAAATVTATTGTVADTEKPTAPANLTAVLSGATVADLAWTAATDNVEVAGYNVYRNGELIANVTSGLTYQDAALATDMTAIYTVTAFDPSGNESDPSNEATVATAALVISELTARITPRSRSGIGLPGATVDVILKGDAHRTASAVIRYQTWLDQSGQILGQPREVELTLPLTATTAAPSTYTGSLPLPAGIAVVLSVTGKLADGAGKAVTREASGLPLPFIGSLKMNLAVADGATAADLAEALQGSKLLIWSDSTQSGGQLAPTGAGAYGLEGLTPASDYVVRVVDRSNRELARAAGVTVDGGIERSVVLTPRLPASLRVLVVDKNGAPVYRIYGQFNDGEISMPFETYSDGRSYELGWRWSGETIKVSAFPYLPYKSVAPQTVVLKPGYNQVTFQVEKLPQSRVEGTVTTVQYGKPLERAYIYVNQEIDGRHITLNATADENGHYSLPVYAGKIAMTVTAPRPIKVVGPVEVNIPADAPAVADYAVELLYPGELGIDIYTRSGGGEWVGPIELNWRVAAHYGLRIRDKNGNNVSFGQFPLMVSAAPGDTFQVCLDGRETGLPDACETATMGADYKTRVEFRLDADALGRIDTTVYAGGSTLAKDWTGVVYQRNTDGTRTVAGVIDSAYKLFRASEAGTYDIVVTGAGGAYGTATATVIPAKTQYAVANLSKNFRFYGKEGNALTVSRTELQEGELFHLRAAYRNAGTALTGAALKLELPQGAALVENTVTWNDEPIAYRIDGGYLFVDLGALPADAAGVVRATFRVGSDLTQDYLGATAYIAHDAAPAGDLLGTVAMRLLHVTIHTLSEVNKLQTNVYGRAPAGSTLTVYANDAVIGQVSMLKGGNWSLNVTLPGSATLARTYNLRAEAVGEGGVVLGTDQARVHFDPNGVAVEELTVTGVHTIGAAPGAEPPRFPVVFIPGAYVGASLKFDDPSRIYNLSIGIEGTGDPVRTSPGSNGVAQVWRTASNNMGPVVATWMVQPKPYNQSVQPTLADMREMIPTVLYDSTLANVTTTGDPTGDMTQQAKLNVGGDPSKPVEFDFSLSAPYVYQPSAADQARIAGGAPTLYKPEFSYSGDSITFRVTVPVSGGQGFTTMNSNIPGEIVKDLGGTIRGTMNIVNGAIAVADALETLDRLANLADRAYACGANAAQYLAKIQELYAEVIVNLVFRGSMMMLSGLLAATGAGLPVGIGFGAMSGGLSALLNWILNKRIDELYQAMMNDTECMKGQRVVADPVWIMDPGGYVYEGLPENRLAGVTTTLYEKQLDGSFLPWDAAWFGQTNPLTSGADGTYAWDVPEGEWRVLYAKDGYQDAQSPVIQVPPPRTDVNQGMISLLPPKVAQVGFGEDGAYIDLVFSQYMRAATLGSNTVFVTLPDGTAVAGDAAPLNPTNDEHGTPLTRTVRFTPAEPLAVGESYHVEVSNLVQNYAGQTMETAFAQDVIVPADVTPTGPVTNATALAGDHSLTVRWTNPTAADLSHVRIEWSGGVAEVTDNEFTVAGLDNGTLYGITLTAIDRSGNESAAVRVEGIPVDNIAPAAVGEGAVAEAAHSLTVTWADPADAGLDHVRVTWQGASAGVADVAVGIQGYELSGLPDEQTYTFTLTAYDRAGNASPSVTVSGTTPDVTPTGPVTAAKAVAGNAQVALTWTDPTDHDLTAIRIAWNGGETVVLKGAQAYTLTGLENWVTYAITLTAIDDAGNASVPVKLSATPEIPPVTVIESTVSAMPAKLAAPDGAVALQFQPKTFERAVTVRVLRLFKPIKTGGAALTPVSPAYALVVDAAAIARPVTLTVSYDKALVSSHKDVALYRQDDADPTHWILVSGSVNPGQGYVRAEVTQSGTYAVMVKP